MTVYKIERNAADAFLMDFINLLSQNHNKAPTPLEYGYPQESDYSQGVQQLYVGAQVQSR